MLFAVTNVKENMVTLKNVSVKCSFQMLNGAKCIVFLNKGNGMLVWIWCYS